ncbi:MAG: aspartate kinase [Bacteroidetes bacterium]|nr:MAG: aspartate kinase [Bacteroidota bacterium]
MIVMKFGGTSTQDAQAQSNVAGIVLANLSKTPVVVISAIAQATNVLERAGKLAEQGNVEEANQTLDQLAERHYRILDTNISHKERRASVRVIIEQSLNELKELVRGVAILRELTPRTLDALYCYGELLSSRLIAATCQERGIDAVWLDTKDFMITEAIHNRALPIMEIVQEKLTALALPLIQQGKVIVTQGFIGVTQHGNRTTMGRESSDYSATIIGAALQVENIQIWTDVDGILTSDPRVVASPKKVKTMLPAEAFELSYFGAKVLHPNTMLPALEKSIPVYIYNSRRPHLSGTRVASDAFSKPMVKSVAYKRGVVVVTISPRRRLGQYIFWEHVYHVLTKHSVEATVTVSSEFNVAICFEAKNTLDAVIHDLATVGNVTTLEGKGIICLVGYGIRTQPECLSRTFNALSGMQISLLSFGASESSITIVMDDADIFEAVKKLHHEFFEKGHDDEVFEILEHFQAPQ